METTKCHMCPKTEVWKVDEILESRGVTAIVTHYTCLTHVATLLSRLQATGSKKFSITILGGMK